MENDDDFTFCQVAPTLDRDGPEGKELISDIGGNFIDESLNKSGNNQSTSGFLWNDKSQDNFPSIKQETVGSLSFSVTDASTAKNAGNFPREATFKEAGTSQQVKPPGRKPVARAKVPFEKGYSQMDWFKLTRTHPDLAGLKGQSNRRLISKSEVKQHQMEGSMWTVLKGHVYNISPYMKFHPGGVDMLMKAVGKDCTSLFNKYHAWVNADFLLEKCLVGMLDDSQEGQPTL